MTKHYEPVGEGLADDPMMQAFIGTVARIDAEAAKQMPEALAEDDGKLAHWLDIFRETFALRTQGDAADVADDLTAVYMAGRRKGREEAASDVAEMRELLREARDGLKAANTHIEHMAAWIAAQKAGYSFEGLGEDSWQWSGNVTARIDAHLSRTPDREPFDRKAVQP